MISEEQILYEQLKVGNESAYGILYRNHYAILCHFANFYLHDRFSAESVVEDVIYHIWENREKFEYHQIHQKLFSNGCKEQVS